MLPLDNWSYPFVLPGQEYDLVLVLLWTSTSAYKSVSASNTP